MELAYRQNGDYLIPNLIMDEQPTESIGKYGQMRKNYLMENRKGYYNSLLLTGKLTEHLIQTDRTVKEQIDLSMERMAKAEDVTEKLKAENPMVWVHKMNSIRARAEEAAIAEIICD